MLIALTGGIGSGKTTVAKHWVALGATEVDADVLARKVVEPGSAGLGKVVEAFGPSILSPEGALERKKLGQLIFESPERRLQIEAILHPLIQQEAQKLISEAEGPVVYTIPLFVETKSQLRFDHVVTVSAPEDVRVGRLVSNRGMTEDEARARMASQATDNEREAAADYVIDSDCSLSQLENRAKTVFQSIVNGKTD